MENENKLLPNGGYPMHTFDDVRTIFSRYIHNEKDQNQIKKAYEFASEKHSGIFRKSGEPYVQHLIEVAYICADLQAGPVTIISAFLHDVVEDTDTTVDNLKTIFGEEVSSIVDSLTKIQRLKLSHRSQEDFEIEDHRKIFLGMAKDVRVIIIKLADRLHNLRTISALKPERQKALAKETLDVFAPIAHRLGMYRIESELEDLSLKVLNPDIYNDILEKLNTNIANRNKSLNKLKKKIVDILLKNNLKFEIEARVKSIYSIYKKMYLKNYKFEDLYDILALRIITETELNCYEILGIIHAHFTPIPGRFKDYIAVPKNNMYQSLHTSIIADNGNIFEVQIRTKEMDEVAETGIAAHWRYKENGKYNAKAEQKEIENQLHWFRDFVSMSNSSATKDAKEYMENLRKDIFEANVYVFTPKGKVMTLPQGACPIDFAYSIHTKVGDQFTGAIVNGKMVPIDTKLNTGDVIEIKTSPNASGPNDSWLNYVKTSIAKTRIRKFIAKKNESYLRDDKISKGKSAIIEFFLDNGVSEKETLNYLSTDNILKNYQCENIDDFFIKVSAHNPTPSQVFTFLKIKRKTDTPQLSKKADLDNDKCPVAVENQSRIMISLGNCCTPIPGDKIVGYVTKGKGITVHRVECPNVINEKARLIDVHWKNNLKTTLYPVNIIVECQDRNNLIGDILSTLGSINIKVTEINGKLHPQTLTCSVLCQILVNTKEDLDKVYAQLKTVNAVLEIKRVFH